LIDDENKKTEKHYMKRRPYMWLDILVAIALTIGWLAAAANPFLRLPPLVAGIIIVILFYTYSKIKNKWLKTKEIGKDDILDADEIISEK
jgi:hypothetical protein